jgi:hypothetical protein
VARADLRATSVPPLILAPELGDPSLETLRTHVVGTVTGAAARTSSPPHQKRTCDDAELDDDLASNVMKRVRTSADSGEPTTLVAEQGGALLRSDTTPSAPPAAIPVARILSAVADLARRMVDKLQVPVISTSPVTLLEAYCALEAQASAGRGDVDGTRASLAHSGVHSPSEAWEIFRDLQESHPVETADLGPVFNVALTVLLNPGFFDQSVGTVPTYEEAPKPPSAKVVSGNLSAARDPLIAAGVGNSASGPPRVYKQQTFDPSTVADAKAPSLFDRDRVRPAFRSPSSELTLLTELGRPRLDRGPERRRHGRPPGRPRRLAARPHRRWRPRNLAAWAASRASA